MDGGPPQGMRVCFSGRRETIHFLNLSLPGIRSLAFRPCQNPRIAPPQVNEVSSATLGTFLLTRFGSVITRCILISRLLGIDLNGRGEAQTLFSFFPVSFHPAHLTICLTDIDTGSLAPLKKRALYGRLSAAADYPRSGLFRQSDWLPTWTSDRSDQSRIRFCLLICTVTV